MRTLGVSRRSEKAIPGWNRFRLNPDRKHQTVTLEEEDFANLVVQHLCIVFHALRDDLTIPPEGLRRDVWQFFSLPIPEAVWNKVKVLQNDAFVAYVESSRNWK